jgi:hypothetical protein
MGNYKEKYRLDKTPLGKGGMAEVFRAIHRETEETYALKRATRGPGHDERLRREIDVLRGLKHSNIMQVLDCDEEHTWYCMPVAGGTLHDLAPELFDNEKLKVIEDIARGLGHAHAEQIVHRDVTPRNILALGERDERRWVIGDFGLVRRPPGQTTSLLTRAGMGTEWFAAPEVRVDGHMADHRSDVYSLGKTIEWMVTGSMSSDGRDFIPEPWGELVRRMTAVAREQRIASMAQVIEALAGIEKALRGRQREIWGGKVALPVRGELRKAEQMVLLAIVDSEFDVGPGFGWICTRCDELRPAGVRLAIRNLLGCNFIAQNVASDEHGDEFLAYTVADPGFMWLEANRELIDLFVPVRVDDDIPF